MNEARFSWNARFTVPVTGLGDVDSQFTIRGDDLDEFRQDINELSKHLAEKGAKPAEMIWRGGSGHSAPKPAPIAPRPVAPIAAVPARRPVGRPPKRPETYHDEEGIERCNHLVNGGLCTAIGEWKVLPDKKDPQKTWDAWSCPEFYNHDDYLRRQALKERRADPAPEVDVSPDVEQLAERAFNSGEEPY